MAPQQQFEHPEFLGRQVDTPPPARHAPAQQVEFQIGDAQHLGFLNATAAPQKRAPSKKAALTVASVPGTASADTVPLGVPVECRLRRAGALPLAPLEAACGDAALAFRACTAGGDDYELLFTAPVSARDSIRSAARVGGTVVSRIGVVTKEPGLRLLDAAGQVVVFRANSFDHFT